jgi:transposase
MLSRAVRDRQAVLVAEHVRVREIDDDEGRRLLRIVRRGTGSVVTWRRAQMVLLSAQGMSVAKIAEVTFTSPDRVRDVIHNFNADGFGSLYPKYKGGRPKTFTLAERREIKKIAKSKPAEHGLPFSTWSLAKLADFLVAEGVVDDISHEGLRVLLHQEGKCGKRVRELAALEYTDPFGQQVRISRNTLDRWARWWRGRRGGGAGAPAGEGASADPGRGAGTGGGSQAGEARADRRPGAADPAHHLGVGALGPHPATPLRTPGAGPPDRRRQPRPRRGVRPVRSRPAI